MRIALTRPEGDNEVLARQLTHFGHEAVIAPLMTIELIKPPVSVFDRATALIVTSRNTLRAIAGMDISPDLPVFAVGHGTAEMATAHGFSNVVPGPGTAAGLAAFIATLRTPKDGALLSLSGEDVAHDIPADLIARGFDVAARNVYRSRPVEALPGNLDEALREGSIDGCILLSPKTAKAYEALLRLEHLESFAASLPHFCLSSKVAEQLQGVDEMQKRIADQPTLEKIVALVNHAAAHLRQDRARQGF